MKTIRFSLYLTSDAEIGSGLGGEILNNTVTRDHRGIPVIRASHLKGLMRDRLQAASEARNWAPALCDLCFGRENCGDDGMSGLLGVEDVVSEGVANVRTISRTSLTELGVARSTSLRTTEAVAAKTVFRGAVTFPDDSPQIVELATRLALLSLFCVGGGRNRGGGACRIEIDGESHLPGGLLKTVDQAIGKKGLSESKKIALPDTASREPADAQAVTLRLVFHAKSPICCPETPVVGNNVIQTGLGIPASAVLGAVIARLAAVDQALAQAAFEDPRTRAWPLLPCAPEGSKGPFPVPVRVALSHRMSKLADENGTHIFKDASIEAYEWGLIAKGSPLKGADGVLMKYTEDGTVGLWRSGDMPRLLTSHSVHHGERRNLFTVESLAPMVFSGWISLPPKAADCLAGLLEKDGLVAFGKARTVRGTGHLSAQPDDMSAVVAEWHKRVFVLQSPAAIPDDWDVEHARAEKTLARLVRESGWGTVKEKEVVVGQIAVTTQAQCGVRFGWNRHGVGGERVEQTNRLRARRVFLPGTVFVLEKEPGNLPELLRRGLGVETHGDVDGRMQGYGAVLPHPGIAKKRISREAECPVLKSKDDAGRLALVWFNATQGGKGPSPSQIAAVAGRIKDSNGSVAVNFLAGQKKDRSARIWDLWKPVYDDVMETIRRDAGLAGRALRAWQDLAIINRDAKGNREGC